jgi:GDPmannose 4,6-dehydratase
MKFYQASTSELFGNCDNMCQVEDTPFSPASPYAAAKLYGFWITRIYREGYGIFACNGILFNHESPLRGLEFVTRKITNSVAKIALGLEKELRLGNLEAKRDWGYAPEYVRSMWLMLQQDAPDDYIIATNETHSVIEFVEKAFSYVGLDYGKYIIVEEKLYRPLDVRRLCGDYSKARERLGWEPEVKFESLVEIMLKEDLERWERWLKGERFPLDAHSYPNESKILSRTIRLDR